MKENVKKKIMIVLLFVIMAFKGADEEWDK